MRHSSGVVVLVALGLAASCSKHFAPVTTQSDAARDAAASISRDVGEGAASRPFRVRLHFVGSVVTLDRAFQPRVDPDADFFVFAPMAEGSPPDTVPAYSVLKQVRWSRVRPARTGAIDLAASEIVDERPVIVGGAGRDSSRVFAPGMHELILQAPPRAGGGTVTVRFFVGFVPGAWWAGPDPALWPHSSDGDGRAVDVTDWSHFSTVPAWPPDGRRYFGPDSFAYIPSRRRPVRDDFSRRTFYEIFGNRIYARSEGDTVHADAWVVLFNGGYDKDSRYLPKVDPTDPGLPPGYTGSPALYSVLLPQGLVGSPIAFKSVIATKLANGSIIRPSMTSPYPNFDPASVFRSPFLAGYWSARFPGKSYALVQAVDSDGLSEGFIIDPVGLADRVDAGGGTPRERLQRREIVTFYVRPAATSVAAAGRTPGGL